MNVPVPRGCAQLERWYHAAPLSTAFAKLDSVIVLCVLFVYLDYNMIEGYFQVRIAFTQIPTGELQLLTTLPFL